MTTIGETPFDNRQGNSHHMFRKTLIAGAALVALALAAPAHAVKIELQHQWSFQTPGATLGGSAAEIAAFDSVTKRIYYIDGQANQVRALQLGATPTDAPTLVAIDMPTGGTPNSIAVRNGVVAIASNNPGGKHLPGLVRFFNSSTGAQIGSDVAVGALPDMLTFTPDGKALLVANEAESIELDAALTDADGSISIIRFGGDEVSQANVGSAAEVKATFDSFNGSKAALRAEGVRIFGRSQAANAADTYTVASDLEPEYITISKDSKFAYVSLQENNAIATVDIATNTVVNIQALGLKDHGAAGNGMDSSDQDGVPTPNIGVRPGIFGMYMPDAIASYEIGGKIYLVSANEGDDRGWDAQRISGVPAAQRDANLIGANVNRLDTSRAAGDRRDTNSNGLIDTVQSYGARSFSIWTYDGDNLVRVYDSGDAFEQFIAANFAASFNASNSNNNFDDRSDNKGPEPEGVVLTVIQGRVFAFIGLERHSGIMVYDVTDPLNPIFVQYAINRNFANPINVATARDLGPEGLLVLKAGETGWGVDALVVANETSGTVALWAIDVPEPATLALLGAGFLGIAAIRRRRA